MSPLSTNEVDRCMSHGERLSRLEEAQEASSTCHNDILVAITASKNDIMLHIDERFGGVRRECAIRHEALDAKLDTDASNKKSSAQMSLQKWQVIAALIGTIFASSTVTTLVSHAIGKTASVQVAIKP